MMRLLFRLMPLLAIGGFAEHNMRQSDSMVTAAIVTAQTVITQYDMTQIAKTLALQAASGKELPDPDAFSAWIDTNFKCKTKACNTDHFGNEYRVEYSGETASITSNGPDGEPDTDDDIIAEVEIVRP